MARARRFDADGFYAALDGERQARDIDLEESGR